MNKTRMTIGENIGYTSFVDKKFNTCSARIFMITKLDRNTVSDNAVANNIISSVNSKIKTLAEMNEQLSELYGAILDSSSFRRGDLQCLAISASWLHDKYAIEKEPVTKKMTEILSDCLFSPYAENDAFNEDIFRFCQKNIIDSIEAELNDKRDYTIEKAAELAFRGEPAEISGLGTTESAKAVTPESAYRAYKNLLKHAQIEIMLVSPEEMPEVPEMLREKFEKTERCSESYNFYAPSPLKPEPAFASEEIDVLQAKIALCFKSSSDDRDALHIASLILGGTPVSKLFTNVREKLSLCYYCACRFNETKNTIIVDCGVEKNNIEKTTEEILHQLDEMKKGNISDAEIQSTMLTLENAYSSVGDTPVSYIKWFFDGFCRGNIITPEEFIENMCAVTKERIVKAAESLSLDSTFHLLNKEVK